MSVYPPHLYCPLFVPTGEMTEVIISSTPMEDMRLSPTKERLTFQIFPDPSDFERCCKLKDRLPSIVVEATEGDVESGELRWPPEEFLIPQEQDDAAELAAGTIQNGQTEQNSQH
ncbi:protein LBH [Alosa sapidissima]|uniref:protein LBH n=1 Tax=Alosa sapidissima TaxID=34773 RepID=UPI001C082B0D|nr:protein LBH [Alosa sapidissima]